MKPHKVEVEAPTLELALERAVAQVIDGLDNGEDYNELPGELRFLGVKVDLWRRRKYPSESNSTWEFEVS